MRNKSFLALMLSIAFLSCSKDDSDSNDSYHITCTIDGVARTFNVMAGGTIQGNAINKSVLVHGVETASTNTADYGFVITNLPGNKEIVAGEYTDSSPDFEILSTYKDNQTTSLSYEAGKTLYEESVSEGVNLINHFKINVSSINNETIRGTFSGDFYDDANPRAAKKTISNGSFFVKLQ